MGSLAQGLSTLCCALVAVEKKKARTRRPKEDELVPRIGHATPNARQLLLGVFRSPRLDLQTNLLQYRNRRRRIVPQAKSICPIYSRFPRPRGDRQNYNVPAPESRPGFVERNVAAFITFSFVALDLSFRSLSVAMTTTSTMVGTSKKGLVLPVGRPHATHGHPPAHGRISLRGQSARGSRSSYLLRPFSGVSCGNLATWLP